MRKLMDKVIDNTKPKGQQVNSEMLEKVMAVMLTWRMLKKKNPLELAPFIDLWKTYHTK